VVRLRPVRAHLVLDSRDQAQHRRPGQQQRDQPVLVPPRGHERAGHEVERQIQDERADAAGQLQPARGGGVQHRHQQHQWDEQHHQLVERRPQRGDAELDHGRDQHQQRHQIDDCGGQIRPAGQDLDEPRGQLGVHHEQVQAVPGRPGGHAHERGRCQAAGGVQGRHRGAGDDGAQAGEEQQHADRPPGLDRRGYGRGGGEGHGVDCCSGGGRRS
jgi:hypothetical protein